MIHLDQPSIAVNDPRCVTADGQNITRYHMWRTWTLSKFPPTRERIISYVSTLARSAPGGKANNLVISCHGNSGYLALGQGFSQGDVGLFYDWEGLFETIWLLGCRVARDDGRFFCGNLAFITGAYVIASTETQTSIPVTYPYGYIGEFEGLVCAFEPDHGSIFATGRNPSAWQDSNGRWHPDER